MPKGNASDRFGDDYLDTLRRLPFVRRVKESASGQLVTLETSTGVHAFTLARLRSHLSRSDVELWIGRAARSKGDAPLLLVAPYVSRPLGARLQDAGVRYVDNVGNVYLTVDQSVAAITGNAPSRTPVQDRAWRAESYQVLFALLVRPELLDAPVRTLASRAAVSTSPVLLVRERLTQLGLLHTSKKHTAWTASSRDAARTLWLQGYQTTLRPRLAFQRYTPRGALQGAALEAAIATPLQEAVPGRWAWGGATAAYHLQSYYRSTRVVVHIDVPSLTSGDLHKTLRMVPDPDGSVWVLRVPGPLALAATGERPLTVHPLLVWAELLQEGNDRAAEAAAEFAAAFLEGESNIA